MIELRQDHMEAFAAFSIHRYKRKLLAHLAKFFPTHNRVAGEERMSRVISYGIERAKLYGFATEKDVTVYVSTMFCVGSLFDTDVQFPWAAEILNDKSLGNEERAELLSDELTFFLTRIYGDRDAPIIKCMLFLTKQVKNIVSNAPENDAKTYALENLNKIYPLRFEATGEENVSALVDHAAEEAEKLNLGVPSGITLFAICMFMMGGGFVYDPQFPWAQSVLYPPIHASQAQVRIDNLLRLAVGYLQEFLNDRREKKWDAAT